ncbi:hypothetical protein FKM82_021166 [Ascaphus truei]
MPPPRYLIKFMAKLAEHQDVNKMTPSNIAIVLGPNLLWTKSNGDPSMLDITSVSPILVVNVVEGLINYAADVFVGDVDFGVSEGGSAPSNPQPQSQADPKSEEMLPLASPPPASTER